MKGVLDGGEPGVGAVGISRARRASEVGWLIAPLPSVTMASSPRYCPQHCMKFRMCQSVT